MSPPSEDAEPPASLRERAEAAFLEMAARSPEQALAPEASTQVLHELSVHQIELEMQNEELHRIQAELDASRARYFDLYDLAPVGYCTANEQGLILEANLTAATLLGASRAALVKVPLTRFISPEDQDIFHRHRMKLLETGDPQACDLRMKRTDGSTFRAHLAGSTAYDDRREPICRIVLNDITDRYRAEEALRASEARYALTLSAVNDGLWDWNTADGSAFFSPSYYSLLGYDDGEFPASYSTWRELVHPDDLARVEEQLQGSIESGKSFVIDLRMKRKSGEWCWVSTRGKVVERDALGNVLRMVGTLSDIAERKLGDEALRKANDRLRDSILRAEELAVEARAATRAKSEFLAVMSHELRSPLNGVLGFAEMLSYTQLDAEQRIYARTISDSGRHLLAVVNDILDFSSIEKGRLKILACPLVIAELVESSVGATRKAAADKGLAFRCETAPGVPDRITGDARRIRQILLNLLGNAIKFTSRGSVGLRVAPAAGGRPAVDFAVEDTGPGISPEIIDILFEPFAQADSTMGRSFEGTGLGLAISRRLAEAMGGSVSVTSTPGQGSTFTLRLPLEVPPHLLLGADGASPSSPSGGTPLPPESSRPLPVSKTGPRPHPVGGLVLVVEDDPDNSLLAGKMIESLGFRAEFAAHGAEAVAAFAPGKFFAILMDMRMPVMNGLDATREIRALESGSRVPIIALTANVMTGDRESCLDAGMDDYLPKPFTRRELAAKLTQVAEGTLPHP